MGVPKRGQGVNSIDTGTLSDHVKWFLCVEELFPRLRLLCSVGSALIGFRVVLFTSVARARFPNPMFGSYAASHGTGPKHYAKTLYWKTVAQMRCWDPGIAHTK
jgi:hypothetical protein